MTTGEESAAAARLPPVVGFVVEPSEPGAGEPVRLLDLSYDPAGDGIALHAWDFGDGTTSLESRPTHRYAHDGTYTVTLHVTARDGRVSVTSSSLVVVTHDVALTRIRAPWRARAGDEATVVVTIESRHGAEIAQLDLFRQRGVGAGAWETAGIQTHPIPPGRTVDVAFAVPFDDEDAEAGHVTFGARATLVGARDATPDDNALTASPTIVRPRQSGPDVGIGLAAC